jgi:aminopeptidase N
VSGVDVLDVDIREGCGLPLVDRGGSYLSQHDYADGFATLVSLRGLWANLAAKRQRRNDGLNYTAWQFAKFVEAGDLDQEVAAKLLWLACKTNGYVAKDGTEVVKEVITRVLASEALTACAIEKRLAQQERKKANGKT